MRRVHGRPGAGACMALVGIVLGTIAAPAAAQTVTASPDLVVSAGSLGAGDGRSPGARFAYEVSVRNEGEATAELPVIEVVFAPGLTVTNAVDLVRGFGCALSSTADSAGHERTIARCEAHPLEAGAAVVLRIQVRLDRRAACGPLTTHVRVSSADEPWQARGRGNHAAAIDRVRCTCRLSIQALPPAASVDPRAAVPVTFVIANRGNGTIVDLTVRASRIDTVVVPPRLRAGARTAIRARITAPVSAGSSWIRARAAGSLPDGSRCTAADATRLRVTARTGPATPRVGGTPFTGSVATPAIAAIALLVVGLAALAGARRPA